MKSDFYHHELTQIYPDLNIEICRHFVSSIISSDIVDESDTSTVHNGSIQSHSSDNTVDQSMDNDNGDTHNRCQLCDLLCSADERICIRCKCMNNRIDQLLDDIKKLQHAVEAILDAPQKQPSSEPHPTPGGMNNGHVTNQRAPCSIMPEPPIPSRPPLPTHPPTAPPYYARGAMRSPRHFPPHHPGHPPPPLMTQNVPHAGPRSFLGNTRPPNQSFSRGPHHHDHGSQFYPPPLPRYHTRPAGPYPMSHGAPSYASVVSNPPPGLGWGAYNHRSQSCIDMECDSNVIAAYRSDTNSIDARTKKRAKKSVPVLVLTYY